MSFTLMRYKDGVAKPIRMSIWDAFRSEPKKSKPADVPAVVADQVQMSARGETPIEEAADMLVPCPCCHKVHGPNESSANAENKDKADTKDEAKNDRKDDKQGNPFSFSTTEPETYSEEDDQKIIEMKANGSNWKPILEAIGKKSESQLKAHWKLINPAKPENRDKGGDKKADTGLEDGNAEAAIDTDKKVEATKKKGEGQSKKKQKARQEEVKARNDADVIDDTNTIDDINTRFNIDIGTSSNVDTGKQKKKLSDDNVASPELKRWSDRYDRMKWLAAASRHFDHTGQRITPECARRLAGENKK